MVAGVVDDAGDNDVVNTDKYYRCYSEQQVVNIFYWFVLENTFNHTSVVQLLDEENGSGKCDC